MGGLGEVTGEHRRAFGAANLIDKRCAVCAGPSQVAETAYEEALEQVPASTQVAETAYEEALEQVPASTLR